jgi:hypothetical protein
VSLRQTQATTMGAGGVFEMPVQVTLTTASGSSTVTVKNTARTQHYLLPTSAAVTGVAIDNGNWILNDGKTAETYVNGPAKVVRVVPAAGSSLQQSASATAVAITFSENVNAGAGAFTLVGPNGVVGTTVGVSSSVATVTSVSALAPGAYTLTVTDSGVTTQAAGIALDGEANATLPSGDGIAGGNAVFAFTVVGTPCTDIDFNNNGVFPEDQDVVDFFSVLAGSDCPTCDTIDFNGNGVFPEDQDVIDFFTVLAGGSC